MAKGGHSHRGTLKNDHKAFKTKHATKGQLKNQFKGKVEKSTAGTNKANKVITKLERKQSSKQIRENKISETKLIRKLFEGSQGAEKIITIITLTNDISSSEIASRLINSIKENESDDDVVFESPSIQSIKLSRFRSNIKVIIPDQNNLISILDAAKVSDYVVIGISAQEEVEQSYGEQILRTIIAQGIASVIGVLPNIMSAYPKKNLQSDIKQSLFSYFTHFFPNEEKVYSIENDTESINCIRTIAQKFPKSVNWRDSRAYMVADDVYWQSSDNGIDGHLVVEGTVRGTGFNANRLVHIPGFGDYQIDRIEKLIKNHLKKNTMDIDSDEQNDGSVFVPDVNQESLEELNPEEIEMGEDIYDYEDLDDDELGVRMDGKNYFQDDFGNQVRKHKVPKGTSDYQSKWLLDDVLEGASDVEEEDEDQNNIEERIEDSEMQVEDGMTNYDPTEAGDNKSEMFVELSPEEEENQLKEFRELVKDELEFPDEIELHPQDSAKDELSSYRGIKSLGTCSWNHDETDKETPSIWSRLLRISNFKATRNRVVKESIKEAQINIGNKARIFIKAPQFIMERINPKVSPFTVYGLLKHEHKLAVVNFSFESWEDYDKPIASKDTIIAQYGPRRQVIQPMFNQGSNNSNNVHKHEKFLHEGSSQIATAIAPVLFNNAPTIFFKAKADGSLELVGQGTFLNCDHTRVIAERAILTGHPIKIHKKVVTIRYMFFNKEDISWFKAVPLFTKSGRTGFIKESLGTHGYFKATFDGKLTSQDVVAMSLYKRVWPEISSIWTN